MNAHILVLTLISGGCALGQSIETGFVLENVEMANVKFADVTPLEFGAEPLPRTFSVRAKMPPPVLQDGNSCVAQAISYGLYTFVKSQPMSGHFTYRMCALAKERMPLSAPYRKSRSPTLGPDAVFTSLRMQGTCRQATYGFWREPHPTTASAEARQNRIDFLYQSLGGGIEEIVARIKRSLHDNERPVPFGMEVGEEFLSVKFQGDKRVGDARIYSKLVNWLEDRKGWHFMLITGWDDELKAFEVFNSFGDEFGDKGYIFVEYKLISEHLKIAYGPRTVGDFGAEPDDALTEEGFNAGTADAYCKLGIRKDRTGEFEEKLFDISNEEIASGKLTIDQVLTAATDINVRVAMPVRRNSGLVLPEAISIINKGDQVTLIDYSAFRVNPRGVNGTQTHYWIKVRRKL